jgi:hypothetical protein
MQPTTQALWNLTGLGLVVACASGIRYSNQAGGFATIHPETEGLLVELPDGTEAAAKTLLGYFTGPKWRGHCYDGIDAETADVIDGELAGLGLGETIRVNREKLDASVEAWVHVLVRLDRVDFDGDDTDLFAGLAEAPGVLTWPNSD